ncbi:MAG: hypothetical protein ABIN48_08295 [Ginsengibacter sp.]
MMTHYRIHIKLDGQEVQEFTTEDSRKNIELFYLDYKKRVNAKNRTGRFIYFDLVMIAEASPAYQQDREEVVKPENNYGVTPTKKVEIWRKKKRESSNSLPTWVKGLNKERAFN